MQGYSRRDFLQFCSWLAAAAGIEAAGVSRVVEALDTKGRLPVVWFHFQECTCCSESFIRSSHPIVSDIVLDKISLDYTETLQAAAGHQAEAALHATMEKFKGEYLMLVEGSVPTENGGVYCCIGGRTALDILKGCGRGIETTADTVGVAVGAATAVGIAAHAITTNIRKRRIIADAQKESGDADTAGTAE